MRRSLPALILLLLAGLAVLLASRCGGATDRHLADSSAPSHHTDLVATVIPTPIRGVLGPIVRASDLSRAAAYAAELADPDEPVIVLLVIDSPGGSLASVPALADAIENELKPRFAVVAHVEQAISAAAILAFVAERITFDPAGVLGAALTSDTDPLTGERRRLSPDEERVALRVGEIAAERGGQPRQVMLAMQLPTGLSIERSAEADVGGGSERVFANDASLPVLLAPPGEFLVLNAQSAGLAGVSSGTFDLAQLGTPFDEPTAEAQRTPTELAGVIGADRFTVDWRLWRELDAAHDDRQRGFEDVENLLRQLDAALRRAEAGDAAARSFAAQAIERLDDVAAADDAFAAYFDLSEERLHGLRAKLDETPSE